jgi:insulin receptor substrate 1
MRLVPAEHPSATLSSAPSAVPSSSPSTAPSSSPSGSPSVTAVSRRAASELIAHDCIALVAGGGPSSSPAVPSAGPSESPSLTLSVPSASQQLSQLYPEVCRQLLEARMAPSEGPSSSPSEVQFRGSLPSAVPVKLVRHRLPSRVHPRVACRRVLNSVRRLALVPVLAPAVSEHLQRSAQCVTECWPEHCSECSSVLARAISPVPLRAEPSGSPSTSPSALPSSGRAMCQFRTKRFSQCCT